MKKAVYYARVSTNLQEEKGTIESQKRELINQIKKDGNILVKEYIDNGWSGGRLDRPALDELRKDLKDNIFDIIYFLDSDRIARDSTYQNLIIAEILKYEKDIVINGKNYIQNPENKFTLTVLGAVNELEKTKIVERMMRGRREKARQGNIVDGGGLFGYNHIKRTEKAGGRYEINEEQAKIIKFIFNNYVNTNSSLNGLVKLLEDRGVKTARGNKVWKANTIRRILMNDSYYGNHYFNQSEKVESKKVKERYSKNIKTISRLKDNSQWILVPIPAIIDKKLFDSVQLKLKRNARLLRNINGNYLLGGLIKCGLCNYVYSGANWKGTKYYRCNHRDKIYNHSKKLELENCNNQAVKGEYIENLVMETIKKEVLKPSIIKNHIDILKGKRIETINGINDKLERVLKQIKLAESKKKRVLDLYADELIDKDSYIKKISEIDSELLNLQSLSQEYGKKIELIGKRKNIKHNINHFCKLARKRFNNLDKNNKIEFIKKLIDEVVLFKNNISNKLIIRGILPLSLETNTSLSNYSNLHS